MIRSEFIARATLEIYSAQFHQVPGDSSLSICIAVDQAELMADELEKRYGIFEAAIPFGFSPILERAEKSVKESSELREERRVLKSTISDLNTQVKKLELLRNKSREEIFDKLRLELENARCENEEQEIKINELERKNQ